MGFLGAWRLSAETKKAPAGAGAGANLVSLNNAIGDVNYADETANPNSVLKTGTGATTTVRGALDALDSAFSSVIGVPAAQRFDDIGVLADKGIGDDGDASTTDITFFTAVDTLSQAFKDGSVDAHFNTVKIGSASHNATLGVNDDNEIITGNANINAGTGTVKAATFTATDGTDTASLTKTGLTVADATNSASLAKTGLTVTGAAGSSTLTDTTLTTTAVIQP